MEALLSEKSSAEYEPPKTAGLLQVPVIPPRDVGWVPQIRSMGCPIPEREPPKRKHHDAVVRAPSPPPSNPARMTPLPSRSPPRPFIQLPKAPSLPSSEAVASVISPSEMEASVKPPYALSASGYQPRGLSTPEHVARTSHS
ncbi:hypothetical protein BV22DRAFT_1135939 [Leucogyrophana mollusca]|uniref:Uncharacterized protein n=1 Tax=Leucogyrophana mollusca TaxID=85980 RepID=A0ACB8AUD9_9AGAM|nr:hypothetical protein BV22DRAFT_1135939 [Leucogyrophana mollusca]